jgi:hypothetical protein
LCDDNAELTTMTPKPIDPHGSLAHQELTGPVRPPGDLQHGARPPVHQPRLHRCPQGRGGYDFHGWAGPLHGQPSCAPRCAVIERLWRSLKYEAVYLHELTDGFKAERVIGEWIGIYNTERPHSALGDRTPAEAYGPRGPVDMMD